MVNARRDGEVIIQWLNAAKIRDKHHDIQVLGDTILCLRTCSEAQTSCERYLHESPDFVFPGPHNYYINY